jgi:hypothetical protein
MRISRTPGPTLFIGFQSDGVQPVLNLPGFEAGGTPGFDLRPRQIVEVRPDEAQFLHPERISIHLDRGSSTLRGARAQGAVDPRAASSGHARRLRLRPSQNMAGRAGSR